MTPPIKWHQEKSILAILGGIVAVLAFVVLPSWANTVKSSFSLDNLEELVSQPVNLPAAKATLLPQAMLERNKDEWSYVSVKKNQTMSEIFANMGISAAHLDRTVNTTANGKALASIRPGQSIAFLKKPDGTISAMRFNKDEVTEITFTFAKQSVAEKIERATLDREIQVASGTVKGSLFEAGEAAGMSDMLVMQLANAFAYDIDFAQDLRRGDQFSVVYDVVYRNGERLRGGDIIAATFINQGKRYTALRYTDDEGNTQYYTEDGRSLKKAFLRTPVEFTRISSRFSSGRMHPILGKMRAHKGVDYAAPGGTPIHASGNGKIAFKGWKIGYGNVVILQHGGQYSTLYGHMSKFAKIAQGQKVRQGEIIGYVGKTGLATGTHLHYEFRVNNVHRDPLSIVLPKVEPLTGKSLARFRQNVSPWLNQLAQLDQRTKLLAAR